jgi:hypothetical protein
MYLEYRKGDTSLRDLDADDVDGICAIYPPHREVSEDDCRPRHGFSPDCKPPEDSGCAFGGSGSSPAWPLMLSGLVLARLMARRRIGSRTARDSRTL